MKAIREKILRAWLLTPSSWFLCFTFLVFLLVAPQNVLAQKELKDFDYWASLCALLSNEKNYTEALAACDQAIALNPDQAKTWTDRAEGLLSLGKYTEALVSADRALKIQPEYSLAWADRCQALSALGKNEEAVAACDRALRGDGNWGPSTPALALYHKGLALTKLGNYADAIAAFDRALEVNPDYSLALTNRCEALSAFGKYEEAIASCEQALKVDKNWGNGSPAIAWFNQGLALRKLGRYSAALAAYDR